MVAALLTLLVASTIGTAMSELSRLEVALARQRRATAAGLAAVDACAAEAVASLPAGWDFDDFLLGDDEIAGTADDGVLPLASGCLGRAWAAAGPPTPPRLLLELEATRRGGRRRIEAVARRRSNPGAAALLWVANPTSIGRVEGTLTLDGADPSTPGRTVSVLAAPGEPEALDAWIAAAGPALVSSGGAAPIWAPSPPLAALVTRAASAGASTPAVGLVATPPATPAVVLSAGDLTIASPVHGAGVLIVDGVLQIEASLTFTGVVAATGGLRVDGAGLLDVQGALWLGPDSPEALIIEGSASVTASAAALDGADALLPLPRQARIASVRDF
jgi:hypothetical protein